VVAHDALLPTARALAADIVANDQRAVRNLKELYDRGAELSAGDALAFEHERFRTYRVDPAEIERRRAAVIERGRGQKNAET
jgi:enoyl-CoA hydratase